MTDHLITKLQLLDFKRMNTSKNNLELIFPHSYLPKDVFCTPSLSNIKIAAFFCAHAVQVFCNTVLDCVERKGTHFSNTFPKNVKF